MDARLVSDLNNKKLGKNSQQRVFELGSAVMGKGIKPLCCSPGFEHNRG
jgi:hypothetical protein